MADQVTNLKVRFGADTKSFKADLESGKAAVDMLAKSGKASMDDFANLFGINLGSIGKSISQAKLSLDIFGSALKASKTGSGIFAEGMNIVKLAIASTGIGLLVLAVGALITYFERTSEAMRPLKELFAGLKAVLDVFLDRIALVGKAMVDFFKGDFTGAVNDLKQAFTGITDEIGKEFTLARQLKGAMLDLEKDTKMFEAQRAAGETKIMELRIKARDTEHQTHEQRKAAWQEADRIETELVNKSLDLADRKLAAAMDQLDPASKKLKLDGEALGLVNQIKDGTISAADAQKKLGTLTLSSSNIYEKLKSVIDVIVETEGEHSQIISKKIRLQTGYQKLLKEMDAEQEAAIKSQAELLYAQAEDDKKTIHERTALILAAAAKEKEAMKFKLGDTTAYLAAVDQLDAKTLEKIKSLRASAEAEFDKMLKHAEEDFLHTLSLQDSVNRIKDKKTDDKALAQQDFQGKKLLERAQTQADKMNAILAKQKSVTDAFSYAFTDSMANMAVGFGESIGNMLNGTGNLGDLANMVVGVLADMAIQVGKIAIATGIGMDAIRKSFKSPFTAIAAGIALVALGTWAKGAISKATSGGGGSTYSGADTGSGGVSAAAALPGSYRNQPVTVNITGTFTQRGQDLVAVIDKQTQRRIITT